MYLDYIKVAENLGLNKELIVNVYKKSSGGYFISLYYAKPPILFSLDNWPKKYMSKRLLLWYSSKFDSEMDQIISLFVTLDVLVLHRVSSTLLGKSELSYSIIDNDIEEVFKELQNVSSSLGITSSPQRVKITVNEKFLNELSQDILNKRKGEINENSYTILSEIAYESEFLTKIKGEKQWIRAINKENILKALALEGKLNDFLSEERVRLRYLLASKTMLFDKLLVEKGIKKTIEEIRDLKNEELKKEIDKFTLEITKDMAYF